LIAPWISRKPYHPFVADCPAVRDPDDDQGRLGSVLGPGGTGRVRRNVRHRMLVARFDVALLLPIVADMAAKPFS
jgi:hypothetical protein